MKLKFFRYETVLFRLVQFQSSPTQTRGRGEEDLVRVNQRTYFAATPQLCHFCMLTKKQLYSLDSKTQLSYFRIIVFLNILCFNYLLHHTL